MKANRIPRKTRLENRIRSLEARYENSRGPSPRKGNPYWCCKGCGVHDPELSIRDGRHLTGCRFGGILKQIEYFKKLLSES